MSEEGPIKPLWTYDFTVITLGSVVSMVGGTISGFALSMMVLDYTGSTFLYALFNVCFQLPMLVCPLLAGPLLDRVSRKKAIYRMDFLSAGLFLGLFLLLRGGWSSYPLLLAACVVLGAIEGVYAVAYDSFYPNLISEGNYSKAYSVSSMLWPIAAMSQPLAAVAYQSLGAAPLLAFNALCFFTAACFERTIRHQETHMASAPPSDGLGPVRRFRRDFREGIGYIAGEKGLMAITLYFMVSNLVGSGGACMDLPFFRNEAARFAAWPVAAVTLYTIVSSFGVAGRFLSGLVQYRVKIPAEKKFAIALTVYVAIDILDGARLFLPIPLMAAVFFLSGALGVTSYNIRVAATQSYIPDGKRARFNGTFNMLCSLGSIAGSLLAGALAEVMPEQAIPALLEVAGLVAVYLFMYRGRREVSAIYNKIPMSNGTTINETCSGRRSVLQWRYG